MICSTCKENHNRSGQRTCHTCHAAYMRQWRRHNPMNDEQRQRDICRSYAGVYFRRGKLIKPALCEDCGNNEPEHMHHDDYEKPLDVNWLCVKCHNKRSI